MELMSKYSLIFILSLPTSAWAVQPLEQFLDAAVKRSFDTREANTQVEQRDGEAMQTWGRLLPTLSASAGYTRNQQAVTVDLPVDQTSTKTITITARDQLEATASASIPLVDLQTWIRTASLTSTAEAQRHRLRATELETERQVARAYFALIAAEALVTSATKSLKTQELALSLAAERKAAGLAGDLDVRRARAEMETARQTLTAADYSLSSARRTLKTLSGVDPNPSQGAPPSLYDVDLSTETRPNLDVPAVQAARRDTVAAERSAIATWSALAPTITAQANERYTNAPGFGVNPFWSVAITARWQLDATQIGAIRTQRAAAQLAQIRADRAEQNAHDQIDDARELSISNRAQAEAAKARFEEAALAVSLAREKFTEGKATQLDVIQAERDFLSADVNRIRALADLQYARALVTLCEGRSLRAGGSK